VNVQDEIVRALIRGLVYQVTRTVPVGLALVILIVIWLIGAAGR